MFRATAACSLLDTVWWRSLDQVATKGTRQNVCRRCRKLTNEQGLSGGLSFADTGEMTRAWVLPASCGRMSAYADRADCKGGGRGAVLNAELRVNLLEMLIHSARTKIENFSDIAVRFATRDPQQYLRLALGDRKLLLEQRPIVVDLTL